MTEQEWLACQDPVRMLALLFTPSAPPLRPVL